MLYRWCTVVLEKGVPVNMYEPPGKDVPAPMSLLIRRLPGGLWYSGGGNRM